MTNDHDDTGHGPTEGGDEHFDHVADEVNRQGSRRMKRDGTPASPTYRADNSGGLSIGVQTGPPIGAQKGPLYTMAQG